MNVQAELAAAVGALDRDALKFQFQDQDELIVLDNFLPQPLLDCILAEWNQLRPAIHRNFIPNHKKGGSVSRFKIDRISPTIPAVYRDPSLFGLINQLAGGELKECPLSDPHTYALYCYTEPGDHIGFHYDNSYYKGRRYTMLLGLIDRSTCKLECDLYRDNPNRHTKRLSLALSPSTLIFFNGDRLYHRVTPLGEGEERIALTMEWVTDNRINWFLRFVSNMKDAIAYFGFKTVFSKSN